MSKTKRILTWCPNWASRSKGGRWRKYIDGKGYYFGEGKSKNYLKAYRKAERNYFDFLSKREATAPVEVECSRATVADICEKYLQELEDRYNRSEITAAYVEQARCCLQDFADKIGFQKRFSCIGELDLADYRGHTLNLPVSFSTGRKIRPATARDRLKTVRAVYRWAYKMYLIERLPRNIDDIAKIPNGSQPKVKVFTVEELAKLWKASTSRTRCYMALALNCGFGQTEISELRVGDINWTEGFIERERRKTGVRAKHKLWQRTLDLLRENGSYGGDSDSRVLLNENGAALVTSRIVNGRQKKSDAVKNGFFRVMRKLNIDGQRGFYSLRKTGATMIEQIDPTTTEMYLCHAENGMKKVYAQRDWERLGKALVAMEERLIAVML